MQHAYNQSYKELEISINLEFEDHPPQFHAKRTRKMGKLSELGRV